MKPALRFLSVILMSILLGCVSQSGSSQEVSEVVVRRPSNPEQFGAGARLYTHETFGGNGVVCAHCHNPLTDFMLRPEDVQRLRLTHPTHPLFNPLNSDEGDGVAYTRLVNHGLIAVDVQLPANVQIVGSPTARSTRLFRAVPTSLDSSLHALMWDGREGSDLAHQAGSAVAQHAAGRAPTAAEGQAMAAFQSHLFTSRSTAAYAANASQPPPLPEVRSGLPEDYAASLRRGRQFFVDKPISGSDPEHGGVCAACHSGPMRNRTNLFNPGDPPNLAFAGNGTSEVNANGLPARTYEIRLLQALVVPPGSPLPIPPGTVVAPAGAPIRVTAADPGALIVQDPTGQVAGANPCISPVPCILTAIGAMPQPSVFHRIPSLHGTGSRTGAFFHDNSAHSLDDVVAHYRDRFLPGVRANLHGAALTAQAQGNAPLAAFLLDMEAGMNISPQESVDIVRYMRYAFRVEYAVVP